MLEIGVNTNNECGQNLQEIIANIKNSGFQNIMVSYKVGDSEEILKLATELNLKIPFVHFSANSNNFWSQGEENIKLMNSVKEQIKLTAKYNVKIAILHTTKGSPNELALEPNEFGLKCFREIVNFAKECNVKIALENLDKVGLNHLRYVLNNIKDENLGFCYDVGHHQLYSPNDDILKEFGNRILAVHLHDNLMDWFYGYDWTRDLHRLPFDGKINFSDIMKKLAQTNYNNIIMLEIHKNSSGEPRLYKDVSVMEFLIEAQNRANKLADMLLEYRNK